MATSELACTYAVSTRHPEGAWSRRHSRQQPQPAEGAPRLTLCGMLAQALILADDGLEITADNILAITKAAKIEVEPYWPALFAKLFAKKSITDLITNVGAGGSTSARCAP